MPDLGNLGGSFTSVTTSANSLGDAISQFQAQNLSPSQIYGAVEALPQTVGGIPGVGQYASLVPGLSQIPLPTAALANSKVGQFLNTNRFPSGGAWESLQYADDLNAHHPKFKFLFKVLFEGFGDDPSAPNKFYFYVHHADRPRVKFQHQDVNFYNFRSRVLTAVTYEPISMTFLDEIGDSINQFFQVYMSLRSGTGGENGTLPKYANGVLAANPNLIINNNLPNADSDQGFGASSSSLPYQNGAGGGQRITIEQIFANGTATNRFVFTNPRIESFEFDELSMEENAGSMATITFSYDALQTYTIEASTTLYSWGNTDLFRGGGTSGPYNGGDPSGVLEVGQVGADGSSGLTSGMSLSSGPVLSSIMGGLSLLNSIPSTLAGIASNPFGSISPLLSGSTLSPGNIIGSATSTLSSATSSTLASITSGANTANLIGNAGSLSPSGLISSVSPDAANIGQKIFSKISNEEGDSVG